MEEKWYLVHHIQGIPCATHTRDTSDLKVIHTSAQLCVHQSVNQSYCDVQETVTLPHSAGKDQDDCGWHCGREKVRDPHVAISWLLSIISFVYSDVTLIMTQSRSPGLRVLLSLFPLYLLLCHHTSSERLIKWWLKVITFTLHSFQKKRYLKTTLNHESTVLCTSFNWQFDNGA